MSKINVIAPVRGSTGARAAASYGLPGTSSFSNNIPVAVVKRACRSWTIYLRSSSVGIGLLLVVLALLKAYFIIRVFQVECQTAYTSQAGCVPSVIGRRPPEFSRA